MLFSYSERKQTGKLKCYKVVRLLTYLFRLFTTANESEVKGLPLLRLVKLPKLLVELFSGAFIGLLIELVLDAAAKLRLVGKAALLGTLPVFSTFDAAPVVLCTNGADSFKSMLAG